MFWILRLRSFILTGRVSRASKKLDKLVAKRDRAEERETNYWFYREVKSGRHFLEDKATTPIDDMLQDKPKATKTATTKATTKATKTQDKKPLPAKTPKKATTAGDMPTWVATCDKATTGSEFARLIIEHGDKATPAQATTWMATFSDNPATQKTMATNLRRATKTKE